MRIAKVINNNVVSIYQADGSELVVMGRGIAFKKKPDDKIDESKIQKVFALKNKQTSDNFKMLLREVPIELIEIVENMIVYTKETLGKKLNENLYVSLTDHINLPSNVINKDWKLKMCFYGKLSKFTEKNLVSDSKH